MKLHARKLDVPPAPHLLARAVAQEPGAVLLRSGGARAPVHVACWPRSEVRGTLDPEPELPLARYPGPLHGVPRWIGLLPYEARRDLERTALRPHPDPRPEPHVAEARWWRYGAVARIADDVVVVGDDPSVVAELSRLLRSARASTVSGPVTGPVSAEPDEAHAARISRALELIREGEIYQVNLARRFTFPAEGGALAFLERLSGRIPPPEALALDVEGLSVAVASPELFLQLGTDGRLLTMPIKGTRPRGRDAVADRAERASLEADPKERAELSMVVDVERNDLSRVGRTGSVRAVGAPHVESFGTVHHRVARVTASLRKGVSRTALLEAMLPSGSVTGAPKIRAMEVIAALESERRGLYTGAFGSLAHDGSLRLGMAIRTLTLRAGEAHYFAGGGIVHGSDPEREVLETRWKAARVLAVLNGLARG